MNLSQSHDSSHEFNMLNWVDPGHFFRSLSLFFLFHHSIFIWWEIRIHIFFNLLSVGLFWVDSVLFLPVSLPNQGCEFDILTWVDSVLFFNWILFFLLISLSNNLILFIYFIFHYLGLMDFVFSILTFKIESIESEAF
jgi:hypothetical protein